MFLFFESIGNFLVGFLYSNLNFYFLFTILAIYAIGNSFWLYSMKGSGLARGSVFFSVGIMITTATFGIIYFNETISSLKLFGIFLGIISIVLMTRE